jgi:hypothetical protein
MCKEYGKMMPEGQLEVLLRRWEGVDLREKPR